MFYEIKAGRALAALLGLMCSALVAEARGIRFDRISLEEGLSSATVTALLQDRSGFLWMGTQNGLNRFDGIEVELFKAVEGDPSSLSGSWIESLLEDHEGNVWIGTQGGGLSRWLRSSNSFERFEKDPTDPSSLAGDSVRALLLDRQGRLWVATYESGLDRLDPSTRAFVHFRHDSDDPSTLGGNDVRALLEDSAGRIWVGTLGGGLALYDPDTDSFQRFRYDPRDPQSLGNDQVRALVEDASGSIWVATHGGLSRMDPDTKRFERFFHDPNDPVSLSGDRVRSLLLDRRGRLWVGTESGLNLLLPGVGGFESYRFEPTDPQSLSNDRVSALLEDQAGILWVGTQGGGLCKWDPRSWPFTSDTVSVSALGTTDVHALTVDRDRRLWIGTLGGGVHRLDRNSGELRSFRHDPADPSSLSDDGVTSLLTDHSGVVWVGTKVGGLNRFNAASQTFTRFEPDASRADSLGEAGVMTLYEDEAGQLWVGTYGGGINRLNRSAGGFDRWTHDPADAASLSYDSVTSFAPARGGRLWVGTLSGGVNLFNPTTGRSLRIQHDPLRPDSLSNDMIMSLRVDPEGVLWVATSSGLNRMENLDEMTGRAEFRIYREADGLPTEFVYGILPDAIGCLWVSSALGLSRFDPATETFVNYYESDGLQSDEFNMNAYFRANDGELFFGGIAGYNAFYPDQVGRNDFVPPVVITGFSKLNEPVRFDRPTFDVREIVLDWRDNVFSFEFAALDYTAPKKNRYRYKLEGFDPQWVESGTRRRATFTNLDPDEYVFRVQASNNNGVWNVEGASVRVVVLPPWWMTWWARSLAAIAVVGFILLAFRLRTRAIRRRGAELEMLVEERTSELAAAQDLLMRKEKLAVLGELAGSVAHELRNPLGAIKNSTFFLRMTQKDKDPKAAHHLDLIDKQIGRSDRIITELLDFGRNPKPQVERCSLQKVIEEAIEDARVPPPVAIARNLSAEPLMVEIDADQINRLLVNLIRNAVQAMGEGPRLEISCRREEEQAIVEVTDNGVGISNEDLPRIFEPLYTKKAHGIGLGLALSQRYAELNKGRIECESHLGGGATFKVVLPLKAKQGLLATG